MKINHFFMKFCSTSLFSTILWNFENIYWRHSDAINFNFEKISHIALVVPLLTLITQMAVGVSL